MLVLRKEQKNTEMEAKGLDTVSLLKPEDPLALLCHMQGNLQ